MVYVYFYNLGLLSLLEAGNRPEFQETDLKLRDWSTVLTSVWAALDHQIWDFRVRYGILPYFQANYISLPQTPGCQQKTRGSWVWDKRLHDGIASSMGDSVLASAPVASKSHRAWPHGPRTMPARAMYYIIGEEPDLREPTSFIMGSKQTCSFRSGERLSQSPKALRKPADCSRARHCLCLLKLFALQAPLKR